MRLDEPTQDVDIDMEENFECRAWDNLWFRGLRGGEEPAKKTNKQKTNW